MLNFQVLKMRNYTPPVIKPRTSPLNSSSTSSVTTSSTTTPKNITSSSSPTVAEDTGYRSLTRSRSREPTRPSSSTTSSRPNSTASEDNFSRRHSVDVDDDNDDDDDDDDDEEDDDDDEEEDEEDRNVLSSNCTTTTEDDEEDDDEEQQKKDLETITEELSSKGTSKKDKDGNDDDEDDDDSTCCDEDFTWVRTENKNPPQTDAKKSAQHPSNERHQEKKSNGGTENDDDDGRNGSCKTGDDTPKHSPKSHTTVNKPPRPAGSLDRRRTNAVNRQERDNKSRSTQSLKEKMPSEYKEHKEHKGKHSAMSAGQPLGGDNHSNGYHHNHHHHDPSFHLHRGSPKFWDFPPPPPPPSSSQSSMPSYSHWEQQYWRDFQRSREELRMIDYHRRQHDPYRYGSNGALNTSQCDLYGSGGIGSGTGVGMSGGNGGCCPPRYPPHHYCLYEQRAMLGPTSGSGSINHQRQDTDERLRRLQSDKESLTLQVQVLSEQVSAQHERMSELESKLTEKTQMMNNIEDLLHREMLTRSSLETQKLELLSAMSDLKLKQAALERENLELRTVNNNNNSLGSRRPPMGPALRVHTSTPNNSPINQSSNVTQSFHGSVGSLPSGNGLTPKTPPSSSSRRQIDLHYSSLPRQSFATAGTIVNQSPSSSPNSNSQLQQQQQQQLQHQNQQSPNNNSIDSNANPAVVKQRNVAFAETEKVIEDTPDTRSYTPQPAPSPLLGSKSSKGLRGIFGKLKRSNSGNLEDLPIDNTEFRRGGTRSTAGARLGWSQSQQKLSDRPFKEWDIDALCLWLEELGLENYELEARRWLSKNGAKELVSASPVDIEKELKLSSPLHRKKLTLAISDMVTSDENCDELMRNAGKLDLNWIIKWLEDVGLPQYKDMFTTARMDGRMLHKLTMDDLNALHITSMLHVASFRRGIQVMRENLWDPNCLIRRSSDNDTEKVTVWTAHRVMEWLEAIDLAEYTPNLRGAGVHGGLMVYEPKFTSELLAEMLSIPANKTLLRRHLALHFSELIGRDIIQAKRDAENTLGYIPLTITSKIKTPKKSQFSLKRKKSTKSGQGDEWSDYVCPMGPSGDHLTPSNQNTTNITTTTTTTTATGSMTNPTIQEIVAVSGGASPHHNNHTMIVNDSPTSTRSSNSTS